MKLKVYGNLALHFSKNRLLGYGIMYFSMVYAIYHALFRDGAAGGFGDFVHLPNCVMVMGLGIGFTVMEKHLLGENELGFALKKNTILAGWISFMFGIIFLGTEMIHHRENIYSNLGIGLGTAVVSLIYGYVSAPILEAFFTMEIKQEESILISEEEE